MRITNLVDIFGLLWVLVLVALFSLGPRWQRRAKEVLEQWHSKHSYKPLRIRLLWNPFSRIRFGFKRRSLVYGIYRTEFIDSQGKKGRAVVLLGTNRWAQFEDDVQVKWEVHPNSDLELQGDSERH